MDQQKIGKHIAEKRKVLGLTQAALAQKLGVTDKSVSKWERGVCLPDVSLYQPLCELLGMSLNEFFAGEPIAPEEEKTRAEENILGIAKEAKKKHRSAWEIIAILIFSTVALLLGLIFAGSRLGWFDKAKDNYITRSALTEKEEALVRMINDYGDLYVFDFSAGSWCENMDLIVRIYKDGAAESETEIGGLDFDPKNGAKAAGVLAVAFDREAGTYRVCIRDEHYGTFCAWKGEMERTGEDSGYNISGVTPQWSSSRVYPGQEIPLLQYQLGKDMMQTCDVLSAAVGHLPPDGRTNEEYLADELQKAEYVLCLSCRFDRSDP